jgi:hypothetical protein
MNEENGKVSKCQDLFNRSIKAKAKHFGIRKINVLFSALRKFVKQGVLATPARQLFGPSGSKRKPRHGFGSPCMNGAAGGRLAEKPMNGIEQQNAEKKTAITTIIIGMLA